MLTYASYLIGSSRKLVGASIVLIEISRRYNPPEVNIGPVNSIWFSSVAVNAPRRGSFLLEILISESAVECAFIVT